ncbi:MAG TPA: hypothetical protein VH478_01040, partial [Trebonia sp.]|nr:hypothetical protein [Trebonia sp.]
HLAVVGRQPAPGPGRTRRPHASGLPRPVGHTWPGGHWMTGARRALDNRRPADMAAAACLRRMAGALAGAALAGNP